MTGDTIQLVPGVHASLIPGPFPAAGVRWLGGHLSYAQGAGVGRWPDASSDAGRTESAGEPGPLDTGAIPGSGPAANPT